MKALLQNLLLGVCAVLFSLAMIEAGLRLAYPKYQYAAETAYVPDELRIFSNKPNAHYIRHHPDNHSRHDVIYNNKALRLHRDLSDDELSARKLIAVFGDSFTENPRLPIDRVFTEQLDYLLKLKGPVVSVLNFGVDGYGPDQEFEYYRSSAIARSAVEVLYVFCSNDLRNVIENGIYSLNEKGILIRNAVPSAGVLLRLVSRLHLTYLLLEARAVLLERLSGEKRPVAGLTARDLAESAQFKARGERLARGAAASTAEIESQFLAGNWATIRPALLLFGEIVRRFQQEVLANGGHFSVVLLPRPEEHGAAGLFPADMNPVDLFHAFRDADSTYDFSQARFKNDGHWNERGNRLAAIVLYHVLADRLRIEPLSASQIDDALQIYDRAFAGAEDDGSRAIRSRYAALNAAYPSIKGGD